VASSYAAVAAAIFTKTNTTAVVTSGKLSGIYEGKAPDETPYPFGIFNLQGAPPITYTMGVTQVLEELLIQFRVYAESPETAHANLDNWIATLGNALTVTGFTTGWLAIQNALPPIDQLIVDRYVYGRGILISAKFE